MSLSALHRSWINTSRIVLLGAMLLLAQLGVATHPLHDVGKQDGQRIELNCAFCVAGTHLQSAPDVPAFHLQRHASYFIDAAIRHVCDVRSLVSPRLTRGPPLSLARG